VDNHGKRSYFRDYLTPHEEEAYAAHRDAVVEKCNLCHHRISAGLLPACVQACPSRAMIFGDLDEEQSELARLLSQPEAKPLREDLKIDPSVFYFQAKPAENRNRSG
jgi:Fe-S-cluster-containing dehydrogenase component